MSRHQQRGPARRTHYQAALARAISDANAIGAHPYDVMRYGYCRWERGPLIRLWRRHYRRWRVVDAIEWHRLVTEAMSDE